MFFSGFLDLIEKILNKNFQNLFPFVIFEMISNPRKKQRNISSFLKKTYRILEDSENQHIVRWASDGKGFKVLNEEAFSKVVLPKYFKHSNYSSFVRQLNMYNFHKMRDCGTESYFFHEYFNRNNSDAIYEIKRKPERKKKKCDHGQDQENIQQSDSDNHKTKYLLTKYSKQSKILKEIVNLKQTDDLLYHKNPITINNKHSTIDEKIYMHAQEDENLSIEACLNQRSLQKPFLGTRELICPSTTNFYTSLYNNNSTSIYSIGNLIK